MQNYLNDEIEEDDNVGTEQEETRTEKRQQGVDDNHVDSRFRMEQEGSTTRRASQTLREEMASDDDVHRAEPSTVL